jgi:NET1-associated nuclear protein 1 (U3 small nucleolar RNA-associated protein 17)
MHRDDLARVAPAWHAFSRAVRNDPDAWNLTGDGSITTPGGRTWISEMYGYLFAAADAGVWHRQLDYGANLVPGVGPIGACAHGPPAAPDLAGRPLHLAFRIGCMTL